MSQTLDNPESVDAVTPDSKIDVAASKPVPVPVQEPDSVKSSPPDFNQDSLKQYIDSMQNIFGNLCSIMGETENEEDVDTNKVSGIFDDITSSLESIVGKDDAMFKNLKKDIKKMKKEMKQEAKDVKEEKKKKKKKKKKRKAKKDSLVGGEAGEGESLVGGEGNDAVEAGEGDSLVGGEAVEQTDSANDVE